jgi:hypothetical protein
MKRLPIKKRGMSWWLNINIAPPGASYKLLCLMLNRMVYAARGEMRLRLAGTRWEGKVLEVPWS